VYSKRTTCKTYLDCDSDCGCQTAPDNTGVCGKSQGVASNTCSTDADCGAGNVCMVNEVYNGLSFDYYRNCGPMCGGPKPQEITTTTKEPTTTATTTSAAMTTASAP
jgi:hypothetical protein